MGPSCLRRARGELKCSFHVAGAQVHSSMAPRQHGCSGPLICASPSYPQIREQNLQDIKTAGPQSQVLCGVVMDRSLVQVRAQSVSDISGWWLCDCLLQSYSEIERVTL